MVLLVLLVLSDKTELQEQQDLKVIREQTVLLVLLVLSDRTELQELQDHRVSKV